VFLKSHLNQISHLGRHTAHHTAPHHHHHFHTRSQGSQGWAVPGARFPAKTPQGKNLSPSRATLSGKWGAKRSSSQADGGLLKTAKNQSHLVSTRSLAPIQEPRTLSPPLPLSNQITTREPIVVVTGNTLRHTPSHHASPASKWRARFRSAASVMEAPDPTTSVRE